MPSNARLRHVCEMMKRRLGICIWCVVVFEEGFESSLSREEKYPLTVHALQATCRYGRDKHRKAEQTTPWSGICIDNGSSWQSDRGCAHLQEMILFRFHDDSLIVHDKTCLSFGVFSRWTKLDERSKLTGPARIHCNSLRLISAQMHFQ